MPSDFLYVPPAGFGPAIHGLKTRCPRPLDEGGASELTQFYQKLGKIGIVRFCKTVYSILYD